MGMESATNLISNNVKIFLKLPIFIIATDGIYFYGKIEVDAIFILLGKTLQKVFKI